MKTIFAILMFLTVPTFAQNPSSIDLGSLSNKVFKIQKTQLAPQHFPDFQKGLLQVNFEENRVSLVISERTACETGELCIQMVPVPQVVELPITQMEQRQCGVRVIHAQDSAPDENGLVRKITVTDASDLLCRQLILYRSHAEYETVSADPIHGGTVESQSILYLQEASPSLGNNAQSEQQSRFN